MVIERIKTNEELFIHLYETTFPKVASFVRKMGGNFDEAKDIFQDALVIYYEKRPVSLQYDESHYVSGIARHLWFKKYEQNKKQRSLETLPDMAMEENEPAISESIFRFIEVSGKKCLELLSSFYYDKMNMKEIAVKFGFSGERSATAQKFKCLEKVRNTIKQRSISKDTFYE